MPDQTGLIPDLAAAIAVLGGLTVALLLLAMGWRIFFPNHIAQRTRRMVAKPRPAPMARAEARVRERDENAPPPAAIRFLDTLAQRIDWSPDDVGVKLRRAGYHGRRSYVIFLLTKFATPVVVFPVAWGYLHLVLGKTQHGLVVFLFALVISTVAIWLPDLLLQNLTLRRKKRLQRAWPDALDLLHLCIDSGMGLEAAMARVAREMRASAPDIADELTMTIAELTYLQNRRIALENLGDRTDLPSVREAVMALVQSERYGVALAETLRTLAEENRRMRLAEAEKKAAALPPRLTVPMILFFLPVLFVVILTPAMIQLLDLP